MKGANIVAALVLGAGGICGQTAPLRAAGLPATQPAQQVVDVRVDPRVELMCIIFRLAGNPEYTQSRVTTYAKEIDNHFAPFRDHEVIQRARALRQTRGVGYDAPMSLAVALTGRWPFQLAVPLDPWPAGLDGRWRNADVAEFVRLANDFAERAQFDSFFKAHQRLYDQSAERLRQRLQQNVQLQWFQRFFGSGADSDFHLAVGLCNGSGNYGARTEVNGRVQLYCVLGVWSCDEQGIPEFPKSAMPIVVHEFSHSYANPLIDAHYDQLAATGERLFATNEAIMRSQAYSSGRTVLYESLVRACVARYRAENEGAAAGLAEVLQQHACGFGWTGEVVAALGDYQANREKFPTLEAFMPELAQRLTEYAAANSAQK
jgi:hypothetical protein